jgi:hypothetical protein
MNYRQKSFITLFPECISINWSNRYPIIELSTSELPYGLTLTQNKIYWTDWKK